jgi:hypothetical protein
VSKKENIKVAKKKVPMVAQSHPKKEQAIFLTAKVMQSFVMIRNINFKIIA